MKEECKDKLGRKTLKYPYSESFLVKFDHGNAALHYLTIFYFCKIIMKHQHINRHIKEKNKQHHSNALPICKGYLSLTAFTEPNYVMNSFLITFAVDVLRFRNIILTVRLTSLTQMPLKNDNVSSQFKLTIIIILNITTV